MNDDTSAQPASRVDGHSRTSMRWLILFVVIAVAGAVLMPAFQSPERRRLHPAIIKMREIEVALGNYAYEHGHLPYDERGPDFALYKLHELLDAKNFLLNEDTKAEPPQWDHAAQRLQGGDVIYINRPLANFDSRQHILMTNPKPGEKWTWVGHVFGGPRIARFAMPPDERILGSFVTFDDLQIVGEQLYKDLEVTHVVAGHSWTTTSSSDSGLMSSQVAGREMCYRFESGKIVTCTIDVAAGTVVEEFETDSLGQIINVRRTPENWRQILGVESNDDDRQPQD